ncbi:hypothetical protein DL96DRAFT_1572839 [Flagelloscypha sp. PMI_526]|nr:hypothetical protein DL96DRAFT_1572839 [Flagelloscypha sp. PMI_526]
MQRCNAARRLPTTIQKRQYAISLGNSRPLPGLDPNRKRSALKGHQYALYDSIITSQVESPVDIMTATQKLDKTSPLIDLNSTPVEVPVASPKDGEPETKLEFPKVPRKNPTLTFVKSSVLGAALRNHPLISSSPSSVENLSTMTKHIKHGYALLSFPEPFDPPQLLQTIKADPPNPGRRSKRIRTVKTPDLRVVGAIIGGRIFMSQGVKELGQLPTLEKLREQLVGLLSQPSMQLSAILNEAAGAKLARTLEGLKQSLEEDPGASSTPPPS